MMVGEALGEDEARQTGPVNSRRPFVGQAGQTLDRMITRQTDPLNNLPLKRDDFLISNVIRCRPPENKLAHMPYEHDAIRNCSPYLVELLNQVKPKVIMPLGNTPLRWFTGHWGIEKRRGYVYDSQYGLVLPTYHPSYIQRGNWHLTRVWQHDLMKALAVARLGKIQAAKFYQCDPPPQSLARFIEEYKAAGYPPLAFDIETPYSAKIDKDADIEAGMDDEEDVVENDPSYNIIRISFSFKPFQAISVPWTQPYIQQTKELLGTPGWKLVHNCPAPDQKVLTSDLRWAEAGSLKVGDKLVGFDEYPQEGKRARHYKEATVTHAERSKATIFKVKLSDGGELKVTGEHQWLVKPPTGERRRLYQWVPTSELKVGWKLSRLFSPWEEGTTKAHGYLQGFYDGEGCLASGLKFKNMQVSASQNMGPTLGKFLETLTTFGYKHNVYSITRNKPQHKPGVIVRSAGHTTDVARFLGEVRPQRLLNKFTVEALGAIQGHKDCAATIISIEIVEDQEIVQLSTSTSTYILEGFASHNCHFDVPRLQHAGVIFGGPIVDNMDVWHHFEPSWPAGLKYIATFATPDMHYWKDESGTNPAWYNAADSDVLLRCFNYGRAGLERQGRWESFDKQYIQLRIILDRMSQRGVRTDRDVRRQGHDYFLRKMEETIASLQHIAPLGCRKVKVFKSSEERLRKEGKWEEGKMVQVKQLVPVPLRTWYAIDTTTGEPLGKCKARGEAQARLNFQFSSQLYPNLSVSLEKPPKVKKPRKKKAAPGVENPPLGPTSTSSRGKTRRKLAASQGNSSLGVMDVGSGSLTNK